LGSFRENCLFGDFFFRVNRAFHEPAEESLISKR
jgi:hypothetical protein